jgi:hypothetical protein
LALALVWFNPRQQAAFAAFFIWETHKLWKRLQNYAL